MSAYRDFLRPVTLVAVIVTATLWGAVGIPHPTRGQNPPQSPVPLDVWREGQLASNLPAPPAFATLPAVDVDIDVQSDAGPLEMWRHALGHGGINPLPLPE